MAHPRLALRLRPYDHVCPLLLGEVDVPGTELDIDWRGPLAITFPDELDAAEISFNRYVLAKARGENDLVGIPVFILRGFRHRNFFVREDSDLTDLAMLHGRRVATNSWSDTGTMWARAAMRDAGVGVGDVDWVTGTLDAATPTRPAGAKDLKPPESAQTLPPGDTLMAALLDGRVDAITTAFAPAELFTETSRIRRLVTDYVAVERDYYRRTGVYPGFHIVAFRRSYAEAWPNVVVDLYRALKRAWDSWWLKAIRFAEASPWAMAEIETMAFEFAGDTPPFGVSSLGHQRMLSAICAEQEAQHLVDKAADPETLFADFLEILDRLGLDEPGLLAEVEPPAAANRAI
ncbi:nitrate ABC transporter substrate-binding protein [Pelagibius sp.]|uniref:nitrate ABC transporter substrate-binding protein n=1 Tax=Pelagibius sp. TaxID=1931238 RepID=UPI00262D9C2B|nr:nitrate ABC transporter substrate-binding protein [Pelagibius sp.]